jgi:hypothetical protein
MRNDPQLPATPTKSALTRVGLYLLAPIAGLLLLPIFLLFIIAIYLLSLVQGVRVFVFRVGESTDTYEPEEQGPHFLDVKPKANTLNDQSLPPPKG